MLQEDRGIKTVATPDRRQLNLPATEEVIDAGHNADPA
jgi:hypothetical protein